MEGLIVAKQGPLLRLTLDRPPLNVLTTALMEAMAEALETAAADPDVRAVRLDARGKAFCAGVDVGEHMGEALRPMMEALERLCLAFERVPVPTVAVVEAAALGGGCELALATDLCLASENATFGLPEIRLGVFAPPASVLLPRAIGERRALGLLLTGETVRAAEAERMGFVNRTFPAASFAEEVERWFERLLGLSGAALRHAKRAVRLARSGTVEEAYRALGRYYLEELMRSRDAEEGLRAFVEKRAPRWQHR